MAGVTNDKMLDRLIRGLKKPTQHEVLKENPPSFADACMLAEQIGWLEELVVGSVCGQPRTKPSNGYAPMKLDSMRASQYDRHH